jgi:hypothetical protein
MRGADISLIERDPVIAGELGADELQEYLEELQGEKPESAVKWLSEDLPKVKVIFALQFLEGARQGDGSDGIHALQQKIWGDLGGILQADGEGFSNESGHQITWQFDGTPKGPWGFASLSKAGRWLAFEMILEDEEQKDAFLEGKIPPRARILGWCRP